MTTERGLRELRRSNRHLATSLEFWKAEVDLLEDELQSMQKDQPTENIAEVKDLYSLLGIWKAAWHHSDGDDPRYPFFQHQLHRIGHRLSDLCDRLGIERDDDALEALIEEEKG